MDTIKVTPEDAFDLLQLFVQEALDSIHEQTTELTKKGDYERARQCLLQAEAIASLRRKLMQTESEFSQLITPPIITNQSTNTNISSDKTRLQRGTATPRQFYAPHILEMLVQMGGSGEGSIVLDRVFEKVKAKLTEEDLEPLPADGTLRWRKNAQWMRYNLSQEGLIRNDSPWGIWEISEKGKRWLKENT
jgi:hypothetical protein